MLEKLDHIGIAVKDLDQAIKLYKDVFGIEPSLVYESAYTKAKIAFIPMDWCAPTVTATAPE